MAGQTGAYMGPNKTLASDADLNDVSTFAPSSGMYQFSVIDANITNKPSGAGSTNYAMVTIQNLRNWSETSLQICVQTYYSFNKIVWRRIGSKIGSASSYTWSGWVEI